MALDIYQPAVLSRVVDDLRDDPAVGTFLSTTFFPEVAYSQDEAVYFDVMTGKPRLSPFVSPLVEGQIVESLGYATNSFRPAYIKDKRVLQDGKTIFRQPGMPISAQLNPEAIRAAVVQRETQDQIRMVNRRLEWMAASALLTGSVTVSGEKYPTTVVNFGRDASLTVTLSGNAVWTNSAATPLDDLETWAGLIRTKSGAPVTDIVMSNGAWTAFRKNADVKALLAAGKFSPVTSIDIGPTDFMFGATSKGKVGSFNIWVYSDSYVDDSGTSQLYIPDGYVLAVSSQLEGVRHYGAIKDEQAGFQATDYYLKSWTQPDPAGRFLMLQSAPLVVPYRVNASLAAKVY